MKFKIYYTKRGIFIDDFREVDGEITARKTGKDENGKDTWEKMAAPSLETLHQTHTYLKTIEAEDLNQVFFIMQGENWSVGTDQAAAQELIKDNGLSHTSMSIGDVIKDEAGSYHMVAGMGFDELS